MIHTLEWMPEGVVFIDQTKLPTEEVYVTCRTYQEVAEAIKTMIVRGAPAIGVAAAMGIALGVEQSEAGTVEELRAEFDEISRVITSTRPTAVNLFWAAERMRRVFEENAHLGVAALKQRLVREAREMHAEDIRACEEMGDNGAGLLPDHGGVLTHCNAGALATCGYGTALGVIRSAVKMGKDIVVFADETRPFLQGSRLTAWELMHDGIPTTVISDNMAGAMMRSSAINCENVPGSSDCAPSESACSGSLCTSISRPSAPAATAARAIGTTLSRRPVPCEGSAHIGKWESF